MVKPKEISKLEIHSIVKERFEYVKKGCDDIPHALSTMALDILRLQFPNIKGKTKYYSPSFKGIAFGDRGLAVWNNHQSPYPHRALWMAYWTMIEELGLAKTIIK